MNIIHRWLPYDSHVFKVQKCLHSHPTIRSGVSLPCLAEENKSLNTVKSVCAKFSHSLLNLAKTKSHSLGRSRSPF